VVTVHVQGAPPLYVQVQVDPVHEALHVLPALS
jgi:hypothetical protein